MNESDLAGPLIRVVAGLSQSVTDLVMGLDMQF